MTITKCLFSGPGLRRWFRPKSRCDLTMSVTYFRSFTESFSRPNQPLSSVVRFLPLRILSGHGFPKECYKTLQLASRWFEHKRPVPRSGFTLYSEGRLGRTDVGLPHRPFTERTFVSVQTRSFHTTPQRHIPPVFWFLLKPVAKLGAILSGRSARKWWKSLPRKNRQDYKEWLRERWYFVALIAAILSGSGIVYYNSHIEETPVTGRQRYIAVTHEQFMKIATAEAEAHLLAYEEKLMPADHPCYQRVQQIGNRLVESNPEMMKLMKPNSWKCYLIDEPTTINAFVLPTGHIFVFKGILDFARNDDQLAVIIAHEMAHAVLNHGIEQVSYAQLIDFLIIVSLAALWCVIPTDGISIITQWFYNKFITLMLHMPYSRKLEKEADKVGMEMAARACYDVREGSVFWARMGLNEEITATDDSVPEWLSTHPSHEKRVELFDFLIPKAIELREGAKCPPLPTRDPRETIKVLSAMVDDHLTAKKTGQNLSKVGYMVPSTVRTKA